MTTIVTTASDHPRRAGAHPLGRPGVVRVAMLGVMVAAAVTALAFAGPTSAASVDADLARLLRLMAALKCVMAAAAAAVVLWRLGTPVSPTRFATYAIAAAAMWAGPGLIFTMSHVGAGALLLHAGLAATILLLWFDPAIAARLDVLLKRRRTRPMR